MKIVLFSILFTVYANCAWSMQEESVDKNDTWREQLKPLCENYKRYLPNQYACLCTKAYHYLVSSRLRLDEVNKSSQLNAIITHIDEKDWDAESVDIFIREEMAPFNDEFGKSFATCVSKILKPYVPRRPECVVCFERDVEVVFLPCGHLVSCEACSDLIESKKIESALCPICKAKQQGVVKLKGKWHELCVKCGEAKPEIFYINCGHRASCEECDDDKCPICEEASDKKIRVYES